MIKTKFRILLFLCLLVLITTGNSAKIADQTDLLYSTYLGGGDLEDSYGIVVDEQGNIYIVGYTSSLDFPVHLGGMWDGYDGFVAKFNQQGILEWVRRLGGWGYDEARAIAVDNDGNIYVAGYTTALDFPITSGAYDSSFNGDSDAFVVKLGSDGRIIYSTYLGGSDSDHANGIAVDNDGNIYVAGRTSSLDFPIASSAYDADYNGGGDAFVVKLNPDGTQLIYSTYLGGSGDDSGKGIAVDDSGNAYIRGVTDSLDFPTTSGAYDNSYDGYGDTFITKLNLEGTQLIYSTYLGGNKMEWDKGDIAVDDEGCVYVCGTTLSPDFPITPGAYDSWMWNEEAYITKINPQGTGLVFSTFLGENDSEFCFAIAIDQNGNAYVRGHTGLRGYGDFPTVPWAYDTSWNGKADIFVSILDSSGSNLIYSTYLGGIELEGTRQGKGITVDDDGTVYITGMTRSSDFPVTSNAYDSTFNGEEDVFVAKLRIPRADLIISSTTGGTTNPVPSTYTYLKGMPVQIFAIPQQGYRFKNWTGDATGTTNPITILLDTNKSITANFIRTYTLTINTGTGGTTNPGPGIYGHDIGTEVGIRAISNQGYEFVNWTGDASGTTNPITITMNSDKTITANFKKIPDKPTCFLSSIFGSSSKEAEIFRTFRDTRLMSSRAGRFLTRLYYKTSPVLAEIVSRHKPLMIAAKIGLTPVVFITKVL